jgi:hypothetical protein
MARRMSGAQRYPSTPFDDDDRFREGHMLRALEDPAPSSASLRPLAFGGRRSGRLLWHRPTFGLLRPKPAHNRLFESFIDPRLPMWSLPFEVSNHVGTQPNRNRDFGRGSLRPAPLENREHISRQCFFRLFRSREILGGPFRVIRIGALSGGHSSQSPSK